MNPDFSNKKWPILSCSLWMSLTVQYLYSLFVFNVFFQEKVTMQNTCSNKGKSLLKQLLIKLVQQPLFWIIFFEKLKLISVSPLKSRHFQTFWQAWELGLFRYTQKNYRPIMSVARSWGHSARSYLFSGRTFSLY